MSKPCSERQVRRFLIRTAGSRCLWVVVLALIQAAQGGAGVASALLLKNLINAATQGQTSVFWLSAARFGGLSAAVLLLAFLRRYVGERTRADLENSFKQRLFGTLLHRDYGSVSGTHSAKWMNFLTSDCQTVAGHLTDLLPGLVGMSVQLCGAVIALVALEPRLLWLFVPVGAVLLLFSTLFRRRMKLLHKQVQEADGELRVCLQEHLSGMTVVRAYAEEDQAMEASGRRMREHRRARMRRCNFSNICNLGFGGIMRGGYWLGVCYCGWGILQGTMTVGGLVAIMQLIGQVQGPMANLSGFVPRYYAMIASAERLMEAEAFESDEDADALDSGEAARFYREDFESLHFDRVSFTYPGDAVPVLRDFSLRIGKQEFVAFTGHSGCGKSTVFRLALGLYRTREGSCTVCGREQTYLPRQVRRLFAYVPQGKYFLSGSIRRIVAFADERRADRDGEIREALARACALEFVEHLPQGLDTVLGEQGIGLSEGQLQRLSVARALFSRRPILLLDEATSALDEETERRLLHNLKTETDRTVLIVTHRPAALAICDRVIDFEEGETSCGTVS